MRHLLLIAALAAGPALAGDLIGRQGADSVRLTEQPCTSAAVLARIPEDAQEEFSAASAHFQGTDYAACWRQFGNAAQLVYEDGDQGMLLMTDLVPAPEAI